MIVSLRDIKAIFFFSLDGCFSAGFLMVSETASFFQLLQPVLEQNPEASELQKILH